MVNFKKNKRGFLLAEETLKVIIAVICILFLVYILMSVYNSHNADKKIILAKEVLLGKEGESVPGIERIISSLDDGESEVKDISDPERWHIYSFVREEKPNSCLDQKCLCICEASLIKKLNSQAKKCDEKGACLIVPNLASTDIDIKIKETRRNLVIEIKNSGGRIFIEETR